MNETRPPKQMVLYAQAGILVPLIVTTIIAIAVGGGEGIMANKLGLASGGAANTTAEAAHAPAPAQEAAPDPHGAKPEKEKGKGEHGAEKGKPAQPLTGTIIRELPPIVTNISMPEDVWIRIESSLVFDAEKLPDPDMAIKEITGDVLSYLRTLSLSQVQGARGLRHLREDLNERVAIRTEGKVKELLIQGMVVQ